LNSQFLSIAGFKIKVQSLSNAEIVFEESYPPFFISKYSGKPDVIIKAFNTIPNELLTKNDLLFEAKNQQQNFFSIYQQGTSYKFIIYDQQNVKTVQQVAILNNGLNEWEVYSNESGNARINPLLYPLGPIVLYYLTVKSDAIMIHASGIYDNNTRGLVFSGFSGSGKSTMAGLWQKYGSIIINDDRLIIRKENESYNIYNTPMLYADMPKTAPLQSMYIIHHAVDNNIKRLSGAIAVSGLMAHCIQHSYNINFIQHHLEFISQLCDQVPVYDVGFIPDIKIVDFIKCHAD
jgi:hypothetical protein